MENDLISRSALIEEIKKGTIVSDDLYGMGIMSGVDAVKKKVENAPAVDAVEVVRLGKLGKLMLPYKGCPRGPMGRMGDPATLKDEAFIMDVITDVDGGRWVPVQESVLRELVDGYEAQRPNGKWNVDVANLKASCSECGIVLRFTDEMQISTLRDLERFCYYCGADMRGDGE